MMVNCAVGGAGDGTRTHTLCFKLQILSLLCLPITSHRHYVASFIGFRSSLLAVNNLSYRGLQTLIVIVNLGRWCTVRDSNPGPTGYEPVALTN